MTKYSPKVSELTRVVVSHSAPMVYVYVVDAGYIHTSCHRQCTPLPSEAHP